MKGLVVVICAPSQGGKDFIAEETMKRLSVFDINSSYATAYKIRQSRENDGKHIKCVESQEVIPVEQSDRLETTIYGSQNVIYDKKEIEDKIKNGEVVFVATGSPDLAKKVKSEFGTQCFSCYVQVQQVSEGIMIREDLKRYGNSDAITTEKIEASKQRVDIRLRSYQLMKPEYVNFVQDERLGADHIFKNLYTLVGGSWSEEIDRMAEGEFVSFANKIMSIHSLINRDQDWSFYSLSNQERKTKNLFSLQDDWMEYLEQKHNREL